MGITSGGALNPKKLHNVRSPERSTSSSRRSSTSKAKRKGEGGKMEDFTTLSNSTNSSQIQGVSPRTRRATVKASGSPSDSNKHEIIVASGMRVVSTHLPHQPPTQDDEKSSLPANPSRNGFFRAT